MQIRFEWNDANAAKHFKKHGVSFEVAARVFADPFALMMQDRIENGEQRWQTIGIISARKADPKERKRYEQENR